MPRSATAESYGSGIFSFLKKLQIDFSKFSPFLHQDYCLLLQTSLWILNILPLSINNIFTYKDTYNIFTYNISTYTVTHFFPGLIIMYPTWTNVTCFHVSKVFSSFFKFRALCVLVRKYQLPQGYEYPAVFQRWVLWPSPLNLQPTYNWFCERHEADCQDNFSSAYQTSPAQLIIYISETDIHNHFTVTIVSKSSTALQLSL